MFLKIAALHKVALCTVKNIWRKFYILAVIACVYRVDVASLDLVQCSEAYILDTRLMCIYHKNKSDISL